MEFPKFLRHEDVSLPTIFLELRVNSHLSLPSLPEAFMIFVFRFACFPLSCCEQNRTPWLVIFLHLLAWKLSDISCQHSTVCTEHRLAVPRIIKSLSFPLSWNPPNSHYRIPLSLSLAQSWTISENVALLYPISLRCIVMLLHIYPLVCQMVLSFQVSDEKKNFAWIYHLCHVCCMSHPSLN